MFWCNEGKREVTRYFRHTHSDTTTHQGIRGSHLIAHQKHKYGCHSIWIQAETTDTRRPPVPGRDVPTPHNMTSILQTNQSMNDRLIARKLAAWPIRLPVPPTHTQWHDKPANDVEELALCRNEMKWKGLVFLIAAATKLHAYYFLIHFFSGKIFFRHDWRLQTDEYVLSFHISHFSEPRYLELHRALCLQS